MVNLTKKAAAVAAGIAEGDYTSWALKCTGTLTNGLRDYEPLVWHIDDKNDVLVIHWTDIDNYRRFGIYNLADLSPVFESDPNVFYTRSAPDNTYAEIARLGFIDMAYGSFSRSIQSYVLLLRNDNVTVEVWRGGLTPLWDQDLYSELSDKEVVYGEISVTGKWIVVGSDPYVYGSYYNIVIGVYEGS